MGIYSVFLIMGNAGFISSTVDGGLEFGHVSGVVFNISWMHGTYKLPGYQSDLPAVVFSVDAFKSSSKSEARTPSLEPSALIEPLFYNPYNINRSL